jgi:acyl-CoA synthetase (AMP-forming)/AMP-acid ligase II
MSPRNTAAAIIKLMKDTSCHRLLTTRHTLQSLIDDIQAQFALSDPNYVLQIDEVPAISTIFPKLGNEKVEDPFQEYPSGTRRGLDDVLLYLHSSGSTGLPKTIPQTFKSMVDWASLRESNWCDFRFLCADAPCIRKASVTDLITYNVPLKMSGHALPPFHTLGIIAQALCSLYAMVPVGLFPPTATAPHLMPMIPTPHNILDHMKRTECNGLVIIPTLLQVWAQDKKAVELLASLDYVVRIIKFLTPFAMLTQFLSLS